MLRAVEGQILVLLQHIQVVACVVRSDPGLFVLHGVENLIHDVLLNHGLLLCQLVGAGLQLGFVGGVDAVAQQVLGNAKGIPGVIEHQDLIGIFLVPQQLPAGDIGFVHILGVVDDANGAPGIGDGVLVLRVKVPIAENLVNILGIGDVVIVQLQQHTLLSHPANHIVGGDDHVHGDAAVNQLGIHALVGIEGGIFHLDIGIGILKGGDDIHGIVIALGDILTPVVDVQGDLVSLGAGQHGAAAKHQNNGQNKRKNFFHYRGSFHLPRSATRFLSLTSWITLEITISTKISRNSNVNMA